MTNSGEEDWEGVENRKEKNMEKKRKDKLRKKKRLKRQHLLEDAH